MSMKFVSSKTITVLTIDPPVLLQDKLVQMGSTDIRAQYEVTTAVVTQYSDQEPGGRYVDLHGFRLTKTGKRRTNASTVPIHYISVTTILPDGTMKIDTADYENLITEAIEAAAKGEVAEEEPQEEALV